MKLPLQNLFFFLILLLYPTFSSATEISNHNSIQRLQEKQSSALKRLDQILSLFEDITECALNKNASEMQKSFQEIKNIADSNLLEKSIHKNIYPTLQGNIKSIQIYVEKKDYVKVALLSSAAFKLCINNFVSASYIQNQIDIENLDAMGFELLAILKSKKQNYINMSAIMLDAKTHWLKIKNKINDENSIDAFNLLLEGLDLSIKNKDNKMIEILASMDLALIDIIEKYFQ